MAMTIHIFAGRTSAGKDVFEEVLVSDADAGEYRLERSPGLALGLAAGDCFKRGDGGHFEVTKRGGNLCIQIIGEMIETDVEKEMTARLSRLGGRLDGRTASELVFTVPASAGFGTIEEELGWLARNAPQIQWFYGNVYDPEDGVTPLNWW